MDPNARVEVVGKVLDPAGVPLGGRPVHMGTGITNSEGAFAAFTLGLSCTAGGCRGKQFDTSTGPTGDYAFVTRGGDVRSTFGEAESVLVTATAARPAGDLSGASVSARFRVQSPRVQLPTLDLVDPGVRVDRSASILRVTWSTSAPGPYDLTFADRGLTPVWRVTSIASRAVVDERVLEDTAGVVVVGGGSTDRIEGSEVQIRWRSPGIGYAGEGVPSSRGRPCVYRDASGVSTRVSRCSLTDGDLVSAPATPKVCATPTSCAPASSVVVELGGPLPAELVVVRGCADACDVAVSADGTTFAPAGVAAGDDAVVALGGSLIRAVRLGLSGAGTVPTLREVSVWGPAPRLRADQKGAVATQHHPRSWMVDGAAAFLLATVVMVLGVMIGRRFRGAGAAGTFLEHMFARDGRTDHGEGNP